MIQHATEVVRSSVLILSLMLRVCINFFNGYFYHYNLRVQKKTTICLITQFPMNLILLTINNKQWSPLEIFLFLSNKLGWTQQTVLLIRAKQLKHKDTVGVQNTYIFITDPPLQNIKKGRMLKYTQVQLCSFVYCFHYIKPHFSLPVIWQTLKDVYYFLKQIRLIHHELWRFCN